MTLIGTYIARTSHTIFAPPVFTACEMACITRCFSTIRSTASRASALPTTNERQQPLPPFFAYHDILNPRLTLSALLETVERWGERGEPVAALLQAGQDLAADTPVAAPSPVTAPTRWCCW